MSGNPVVPITPTVNANLLRITASAKTAQDLIATGKDVDLKLASAYLDVVVSAVEALENYIERSKL